MTAHALPLDRMLAERADVRGRTRWTMTLSVMLHAILFLLLLLPRPASQGVEALTEITMLGPGDLEPAPAAGGAQAPRYAEQPTPGARVASTSDASFRRRDEEADVSPELPSLTAVDRMTTRLAALREDVSRPVASSNVGGPSALWTTPAGASGTIGGSGQAVNLTRAGTGGGGASLSLGRGGGGSGVSTTLAGAGAAPTRMETPAGEAAGEAHARRTLAGAQLAGPIADRAVTHSVTPAYPDWAKSDGVEAAVTLYFIVRADGTVKENILVQKTAGFGDFDDSARQALAAWRFEPLHGGRTGEQWGTITFHFRLRGA
jgi:TonB family protein